MGVCFGMRLHCGCILTLWELKSYTHSVFLYLIWHTHTAHTGTPPQCTVCRYVCVCVCVCMCVCVCVCQPKLCMLSAQSCFL